VPCNSAVHCCAAVQSPIYTAVQSRGRRPGASQAVANASEPRAPLFHITSIVELGRIVNIRGTTEPETVVMINGQTVSKGV
jgi:hypothetical protein